MGKRIGKKDLEDMEKSVNELLSNVKLRVSQRYDYIAIDILKSDGTVIDVLEAGLTKYQAYSILRSLYEVLRLDKSFSK